MDIRDMAESYKREMMKLYSKSTAKPVQEADMPAEPIAQEDTATDTELIIQEETQMPEEETSAPVVDTEENYTSEENIMPLEAPSLPLEAEDFPDEQAEPVPLYDESEIGDSYGYIKINTRTGDGSSPVAEAEISVTALVNGRRYLVVTAKTDESGSAGAFRVPVPDKSYSLKPESAVRPYALYDISVTADGFFNTRSVDVPVFSGITSVQNFSMIPVPLYMKPEDEIVVYYNQEPTL